MKGCFSQVLRIVFQKEAMDYFEQFQNMKGEVENMGNQKLFNPLTCKKPALLLNITNSI